jgi:hypothetical protein
MHVLSIFISSFLLVFEDFKMLLCFHVPFYSPCMFFLSVGFCLLFYNSTYSSRGVLLLLKLNQIIFCFFSLLMIILCVLSLKFFFFCVLSLSLFMCIVKEFKWLRARFCFSKIKLSKKIHFFILLLKSLTFLSMSSF